MAWPRRENAARTGAVPGDMAIAGSGANRGPAKWRNRWRRSARALRSANSLSSSPIASRSAESALIMSVLASTILLRWAP